MKPCDLARHPALLVEFLLADDLAHEALLVVLVEDLEVLRQAGLAPVPAQHAVREPVERADPERVRRHAQQRLDARAHLGGRLVRERHGHQRRAAKRRTRVISQAARCVSTRVLPLPAPASTSIGPDRRGDRGALGVVQGVEQAVHIGARILQAEEKGDASLFLRAAGRVGSLAQAGDRIRSRAARPAACQRK